MLTKSINQMRPIVVRIIGFSEKKNKEVKCYSDLFYYHDKGYKMCLCVDTIGDGDGKGTHLSVFLWLLKGSYDDELTWPLRGTIEVKVLNQINDCGHHIQCTTVIFDVIKYYR